MQTVYYDVENTLQVPFITGIQRVTRELSKIVLDPAYSHDLPFDFKPIRYDYRNSVWRELSQRERHRLLHDQVKASHLAARISNKLKAFFPPTGSLHLEKLDETAIFLDIDSSWHSKIKREQLLPELKNQGLSIAKLHYDIIPLLFPETTHPNTVNVFKEHFVSHLQYADAFLCISQCTANDVTHYCQQHSLRKPELVTIRLGTNPTTMADQPAIDTELRQRYGRYLLAVGTLEPRKNYAMLLQAFRQIRDATDLNLVIVGKTGWLADELLQNLHSGPDFGTRIHHLSAVDDQQLDALYRSAWLTVVPSLYEGYGLPLSEALNRGCPTISSNAGSLEEVGGDSVRFFNPETTDELTDIIRELDNNADSYASLKSAANQYSPTRWSDTVLDITAGLQSI